MNFRPAVVVSLAAAFSLLAVTDCRSDEPANVEKPAADPMLGKKLGQVRDDNGLKMKLVWCPPGFLTMEQVEIVEEPVTTEDEEDEDEPAPKTRRVEKITPVKVLLTQGYWLGKYEVTQSEWKQVMKTEPWKDQDVTKEGADFPATFVSWNDATDFCRKLTEQERQAGRLSNDWEYTLPTEAQWERACRARTETRFSFGDDESKLGDYAWFGDNACEGRRTIRPPGGPEESEPVGPVRHARQRLGMVPRCLHGEAARRTRPGGETGPENKGLDTSDPGRRLERRRCYCRSAYRDHISSNPDSSLGFRVALSAAR